MINSNEKTGIFVKIVNTSTILVKVIGGDIEKIHGDKFYIAELQDYSLNNDEPIIIKFNSLTMNLIDNLKEGDL